MYRETKVKQYRAVFSGSRLAAWKKYISYFPTLWYNWNQHRTKNPKSSTLVLTPIGTLATQRYPAASEDNTESSHLLPSLLEQSMLGEQGAPARSQGGSQQRPAHLGTSDLGYFLLTSKAAQSHNSHFK